MALEDEIRSLDGGSPLGSEFGPLRRAIAGRSEDPATMPVDQLGDAIVISSTGDVRMLLLNPARLDAAGEWEAWDFASWYPGAYRYPSFARLVEALVSGGW